MFECHVLLCLQINGSVLNCDLLFFPVPLTNHWGMAYIDLECHNMELYDSMSMANLLSTPVQVSP